MQILRLAAVAAVTAALASPAAARAATPLETDAATAPAYPGNTITAAFTTKGDVVAGTLQTADLAGHAEFGDPGSRPSYTPSVFLQDATVDPACAPSIAAQRQKFINNTAVSASGGASPWVLDEGQFSIQPSPPATGVDWSTRTQPFSIRLGVKQVLVCAYVSYVVDDVAVQATRWAVAQPVCKPTAKTVRRGKTLALKCNFSGAVYARLVRGRKTVKRKVTLGSGQRGRLSTGGARRGRNTLSFSLDGKVYGSPLRVRVT